MQIVDTANSFIIHPYRQLIQMFKGSNVTIQSLYGIKIKLQPGSDNNVVIMYLFAVCFCNTHIFRVNRIDRFFFEGDMHWNIIVPFVGEIRDRPQSGTEHR